MAQFTSIGQAARKINTAIKSGTRKALNDAIRATNKEVLKSLKDETKLPTSVIKPRVWMFTASTKIPRAAIKIAAKFGMNLGDAVFKPKEKAVRVTVGSYSRRTKNGSVQVKSHKRKYFGVTVQLGKLGRILVDGGFYRILSVGKANRKLKDLILTRKGEGAYPTASVKTDIFRDAARNIQQPAIAMLYKLFNANTSKRINEAMNKAGLTGDDE